MNHETRTDWAGLTLSRRSYWQRVGSQHQMLKPTRQHLVPIQQPSSILDYSGDNTNVITNLVDACLKMTIMEISLLGRRLSVSKDGLTYTYKLSQDAKWFTADGGRILPIKAQDFRHRYQGAADNKSQALDLIQNSIKGLDDYVPQILTFQ